MSARRMLGIVAAAALLASCSTSTQDDAMPDCTLQNGSAVILVAQAVPSASLIPCIAELDPGWRFGDLDARRGAARLTVSSSAMGGDFLDVHLSATCPPAPNEELLVVPGGSARLSRDVVATAPPEVGVAIVPRAGRHAAASSILALDLEHHGLPSAVVPAGRPVHARVAAALEAGNHALVVDDLSLADAIVQVYEPGRDGSEHVDRDDLVDLLREYQSDREDQTYRGTWQFRFNGGCVTYDFDAAGPGAATLGERVPGAVSFVSRAALDRFTRLNVGLRLDP